MAPIIWSPHQKNTVEVSTFGAEFVNVRTMIEIILGLHYKLRIFGIPIDSSCNIYCDNEAVTKSSMKPHATLKKTHISIAFHQVREAVVGEIALIFYEKTKSNHADLITKVLNYIDRKSLLGYICGKNQRINMILPFLSLIELEKEE